MENMGISSEKLDLLKQFVGLCKLQPAVLHAKDLTFFKTWLIDDLKATIPEPMTDESGCASGSEEAPPSSAGSSRPAWSKPDSSDESSELEEEEVESDLDIDMEGVIAGDTDPPQEMGDNNKEVTEEERDQAMSMRQLGMEAMSNGDNEGAIKHFTAGILLDSSKTILFAKRATAYLRLAKPNAAIRDCMKALEINPDSAAAYKVMGKSHKLLGHWDEACHDFEVAQKIDYDDNIYELLKEVKPKATKIREHKMSQERRRKEREVAERLKRVRKAKKAQEKARKEQERKDREFEEQLKREMPNFNFGKNPPDMSGFNFGGSSTSQDESTAPDSENDHGEPKVFEVPTDVDVD